MKVTFPHMGNLHYCLKAMLTYLGVEVVVPPPSTRRTLNLGSKYSPEFACMPLKLNLGNFIEAKEQGADTILMAGGCGPCRFGYYAQVEHSILEDLGYQYQLVVMEPPEKHIGQLISKIRLITGNRSWLEVARGIKFGFRKAKLIDSLERRAMYLRPRETTPYSTDIALEQALQEVGRARGISELDSAGTGAWEIINSVVHRDRPVLKVGLVGEIYTLLDPFSNGDLEKKLGRLGVEVDRSIYLSEWVNDHLFMGFARGLRSSKEYCRAASPYLEHFVGGHGQETIGSSILYARQGFDGVIQVLPFTCMPEIVAQSILPVVNRDTGMPIMTLIVDEMSGEAGLVTRLEAFVDLVQRKAQFKEALAR